MTSLVAAARLLHGVAVEVVFVSLGLTAEQEGWLAAQGVRVAAPDPMVPRFPDAPDHAYAQTCRPYLPAMFPGHDGYVWVDSDLRFLDGHGLAACIAPCLRRAAPLAVATENDPSYVMMSQPAAAGLWHAQRRQRVARIYGEAIARRLQPMAGINSGFFAAAADSPLWAAFAGRLEQARRLPYDRLAEQDALNVAVLDVGGYARLPPTMNWLCSWRIPHRRADGSWCHPDHWHAPIHVLHLTNAGSFHTEDGRRERLVDMYRRVGLPV
ncbi:hypothetical protein [Allostella humosa]|uniref:hypothetical protein n=1 Tax=Stella humosa TaxID=94 RepID=UPI000F4BBE25|nr:hypothetical protein [Stella humosa]